MNILWSRLTTDLTMQTHLQAEPCVKLAVAPKQKAYPLYAPLSPFPASGGLTLRGCFLAREHSIVRNKREVFVHSCKYSTHECFPQFTEIYR